LNVSRGGLVEGVRRQNSSQEATMNGEKLVGKAFKNRGIKKRGNETNAGRGCCAGCFEVKLKPVLQNQKRGS